MVAKPGEPCYTVSRIRIEGQKRMRDGNKVLPPGWQKRVLAAAAAALAGNLLVNVIPWPGSLLSSYEAMIPAIYRSRTAVDDIGPGSHSGGRSLPPGSVRMAEAFHGLSSGGGHILLAFGIYHGNWIQGTYAFLLGMVLAWGYEGSEYRKYPMAVLMHGAANLAALAARLAKYCMRGRKVKLLICGKSPAITRKAIWSTVSTPAYGRGGSGNHHYG